MSSLDKHILDEQWRPDRRQNGREPERVWRPALKDLDDKYGRRAVASRLNIKQDTLRRWIDGKENPRDTTIPRILEWWGEDRASDMDDATIYFVQALRYIQKHAEVDGEAATVTQMASAMEDIREMTERTMEYLRKRIDAPV